MSGWLYVLVMILLSAACGAAGGVLAVVIARAFFRR